MADEKLFLCHGRGIEKEKVLVFSTRLWRRRKQLTWQNRCDRGW